MTVTQVSLFHVVGFECVAFQNVNCYFLRTPMMKLVPALCLFVMFGCNGGLSPTPSPKPGIGGTVYFARGTWPGTPNAPDSLSNLWIFASQVYPLDSSLVFSGLFSDPPTIYLYPSIVQNLPLYVDSVSYFFPLPLGVYKYVGVIQHLSASYSVRSMRVVGFARNPADTSEPLEAHISQDAPANAVDIFVDFHNPPPQPF